MKTTLLLLIATLARAPSFAQTTEEAVTTPDPSRLTKICTPTTTSVDPTGAYHGEVDGRITGFDGTGDYFLGNWEYVIRPISCLDCLPRQYRFRIDYKGITYQRPDGTLAQEVGLGFGVLNPDRGVIEFLLLATNCSAIAGSVRAPGVPPGGSPGFYFGGHDGEAPGHRVEINAVQIGGRLSGRDCYNQVVVADPLLGKR